MYLMRPMLATRGTTVPSGAQWLHEVKWDGIRLLAEVTGGRVRLWSRNENDVSLAYPELMGLAEALAPHDDVLVDGEVVAFADGVPSFGALADRMHVRNARRAAALAASNPVTLMCFDLLRIDGEDLMDRPLTERRERLEALGLADPRWQVPAAYDDGAMLMRATAEQGLEGVVSKKRSSRYTPGRRTADWLKFPHRRTESYVVGGWRLETDSGARLGALLVGEPTAEGLRYRGRVGSGLAGRKGQAVLGRLRGLESDASPFADTVPKEDALGTTWLRPELVAEVAALGTTRDGRLRQPAFLGLRTDLSPASLTEADEADEADETEEPT
jgi:bifunctional non-homologous end joining protein LigD